MTRFFEFILFVLCCVVLCICHPERSEGSPFYCRQIPHFIRNDRGLQEIPRVVRNDRSQGQMLHVVRNDKEKRAVFRQPFQSILL